MVALELGCLVFYSLPKGEPEQVLEARESRTYTIAILESSGVNSNYTSVT